MSDILDVWLWPFNQASQLACLQARYAALEAENAMLRWKVQDAERFRDEIVQEALDAAREKDAQRFAICSGVITGNIVPFRKRSA